MGVVVKGLKYVQKIEHVKGHLKYIGFRSNELATSQAREEYGLDNTKFFSKDSNNADYKAFIDRIENHKALKHSKSVKMHKMVFSLKQEDYKNYLLDSDGKDFKDLVRKTLDDFSKYKGQQYDWIAVEHLTDKDKLSTHPHIHLCIKGVTEQGARVKFTKEDYQFLREKFDVEYNKVCEYESKWEHGQRQYRQLTPLQTLEKDIANSAKKIFNAMERDVERAKYERFKIQSEERKRAKKREIERQLDRQI
ncbi:MAG: hypothetical protein J6D47_21150 [Peptostreptococcaceae bacterium]|nr:hypothetical protein [Peptostreptococcaceae bacterium]MBP3932067.1 hypothetical protein [Peptostreptococcaceae bacterium]